MSRCPSIDELERALDEKEGAEDLRAHLVDCTKCRNRARRIEENNGFLRGLGNIGIGGFDAATSDALPQIPGIEGFELLRELHRGGQGVIYLARQTATKRIVAIKMLLSAALATSRQRRRFEREIEIVAGLRHSQIVTVFESGVTAAGLLWFAMEYVDGVPLDVHLNQQRPPMNDVLRLMANVCEAVAYAHQRGIIHRDLKPANILVDREGRPHVLDFGLAKATGSASPDAVVAALTVATQPGEFMGTYAYAAPEQFRGAPHQIDTRTDVYALGTILYEALTGQHPFPASGSLPEFIRAADQRTIVPPSELARGFPAELEAVVLCALSMEPGRRYQSAGSLAQDLLRFVTGEPVEARRDSRWYLLRKAAHRHRFAMTAAGAFVAVAISFAILATFQAQRVAQERDKALSAEQATARTAQTLAEALSASNIERGRLLVRSGNISLGERMIWREWLASPTEPWGENPWPPDNDAYWALWETYSKSPCCQTLQISANVPKSAVSRDQELLATCTTDGALKLWKLPEITPLREFSPTVGGIFSLAFSPNRELLAAGDGRGDVSLWNISSGEVVRKIHVQPETVRGIHFTSDGKSIAIHGDDRRTSVWSIEGPQLAIPSLDFNGIRTIDVDPVHRRMVVSEGSNERVVLVDLDGKVPPTILPKYSGPLPGVTSVRFSPDGKSVALGRLEGSVDLWEIASQRRIWSNRLHRAASLTLDFSPDGSRLVSGGRDRTIHLLNAADGTVLRTLSGHTGSVATLSFFDGAARLVTTSLDGFVKIWDVRDRQGVRVVAQHGHTVFHVNVSPDGRRLSSCAAGGATPVRISDTYTGENVVNCIGHEGIVSSSAFSPDQSLLATGGFDNDVRLWNVKDGACKAVLKGHENRVESVSFCLGGSRLASAGDDNTVRIWDVASGECKAVLRGHTGRCPQLAVSPDGQLIASCSTDCTVRLWSAVDGCLRGVCLGSKLGIRAVCFTPDGKHVISGGDDTTIRIWDVASQQCIATLDGNDQDIFCVAVSPDGRFVASTTRGGAVQLWSFARHRYLATLAQDEKGSVFSACFTPDGRSLAICGEDGCARLLDLTYFDSYMAGNRDVQAAMKNSNSTNGE